MTTPDPDPSERAAGTPPADASSDYARSDEVADGGDDAESILIDGGDGETGGDDAESILIDGGDGETGGDEETILIDGRTLRGAGLGSAAAAAPATSAEPHAAPVHHSAGGVGDSGLRALRRALRTPRARGPQLLIGLLCGLLGFFAVVQIRVTAGDDNLRNLRQGDLIRILDDLNDRSDRLDREIRELQTRRAELQSGTDSTQAALEEATQRRAALGILAGTVPARGPGITLRITDPDRKVDAPVLLDTLQELRDAGAEAVQINDVRVVAGTAFLDAEPGSVRIDGRLVTAPYVFTVIGDPDTLDPALRIPGGVFAVLNERGAAATVTAPPVVFVEATVSSEAPQYSRPIAPPS